MKLLRTIMLFAMLGFLTGCFSEDYSMCPPKKNVALHFTLPDKHGNCIFASNVSKVDLMIYDASGAHIATQQVDQDALNEFQGTRLALKPGTYSVVCWGNVHEKLSLEGVKTHDNPFVTYQVINGGMVGHADRVYHGGAIATRASNVPTAVKIIVPQTGNYEGDVVFKSAHRQVEVLVKGYTENFIAALPQIELSGLPADLSIFDKAHATGNAVTSKQNSQEVILSGTKYTAAQFTTFWFDLDNTIVINLYSTTGELVYSIPLKDAISPGTDPDEIIIQISLEFRNGTVEVIFENWNSGDIDWKFDYGM